MGKDFIVTYCASSCHACLRVHYRPAVRPRAAETIAPPHATTCHHMTRTGDGSNHNAGRFRELDSAPFSLDALALIESKAAYDNDACFCFAPHSAIPATSDE